jgi:hypothetical protein
LWHFYTKNALSGILSPNAEGKGALFTLFAPYIDINVKDAD